jgi:hypothetical protein
VKAISIPPDQYTDALKAIEIFITPILAEVSKMRLPLPAEPDPAGPSFKRNQWLDGDFGCCAESTG